MSLRKHIPDAVTSMNLLSGCMGVIAALSGYPGQAFLLMLAGAVFDFFDGMTARLLGAHSAIGKELDSLADVVSFGVLPSVSLYEIMRLGGEPLWLSLIPLVLAVFSALRLASFNIDERQVDGFIGLPTPAAAMICGSIVYLAVNEPSGFLARWCAGPVFVPVLSIVLSALLVSGIPMFSMKIHKGAEKDIPLMIRRTGFLTMAAIIAVVVAVMKLNWAALVLLMFVAYILMNLVLALVPSSGASSRGTA